ncbi:hypothetical protein [Sphingobacterium allocomposti]|nr:hypothetical protein [Sphingobacterium composti Yoo et al. 2007 non Ten et al. 2007]
MMTQHLKTVLWFNIAIAVFFILSYSNVEFFESNLLRGVLTFVHELFILLIATIVIFSFLYALILLVKRENTRLKILLVALASLNIFFTFILPGLKSY